MGVKTALLLDFTFLELKEILSSWDEPAYRAEQLWNWIYRSLAEDFTQMTNLPLSLRQKLGEAFHLAALEPLEELTSKDGLTRKILFSLADGETIESVLMRYERRRTVCLSTQVGCAIGCPFCATGQSGLRRNLSSGEIVAQVLFFARALSEEGEKVDNVVFMGMGEPLANYQATWKAIETLHDSQGFNLGARRITVSTIGLVPDIEKLSRESLPVGLAVSLHAPKDDLRDRLVPINRRYGLDALLAACRRYVERTGRRLSFEYVLIDGLNDSPQLAQELAWRLKGLLCHVNLIPLNPVEGCTYRPSPRPRVEAFQKELARAGINATVRLGRGIDIQAGCGQLRARSPQRV